MTKQYDKDDPLYVPSAEELRESLRAKADEQRKELDTARATIKAVLDRLGVELNAESLIVEAAAVSTLAHVLSLRCADLELDLKTAEEANTRYCEHIAKLKQLARDAYIDGFKTGVHVRKEREAAENFDCSVSSRKLVELSGTDDKGKT